MWTFNVNMQKNRRQHKNQDILLCQTKAKLALMNNNGVHSTLTQSHL